MSVFNANVNVGFVYGGGAFLEGVFVRMFSGLMLFLGWEFCIDIMIGRIFYIDYNMWMISWLLLE